MGGHSYPTDIPMFRQALILALAAAFATAQDSGLREAARLDSEGKCDEAERAYRQALSQGAPTAALLNNFGNHFLVCGQPDQAGPWFERLLKLNPAHENANLQMARIETDRGHGAVALQHLARVRDSGFTTRLLRAQALHLTGQRTKGLAILDSLEKESAGDAEMLFPIGIACARLGLYARAETLFNGMLAKHPDDFDLLFNLGRAAARAGHHGRAARALEAAAKLRPLDAGTLLEMGLLHAARQDYSRAVYLLARASQRAPEHAGILLALARASESAGYYGDSAIAYDRYLKLHPEDDSARRDRALVLGQTESRLAEGLGELEWYARKHPKDPAGHFNLAQLSWRVSPQKALDQLSIAVRIKPEFVAARLARAWLLHRLGRVAESLPDLQAAIKISPDNVRVLGQLGLAYLSLDRPASAEKTLRHALTIAPEDPDVLLHLGRTLMALSRDQEAQTLLDKFQSLRSRAARGPRKQAGMIELATLPSAERTRREIERLRVDAAANPGDPELQLSLALLLLAEGGWDDAAKEFRELSSRNAGDLIWERAGVALLSAGHYPEAREFLERAAAKSSAARLDLALALFFTEGPEPALRALDDAPAYDRNGDYLLLKARLLAASGRDAKARTVLSEGLRMAAPRPQVAAQAAILLLRYRRNTEAIDILDHAIGKSPDSEELALARVVALGLAHRMAEAERSVKEVESRWPEWDGGYAVHGLLLTRGGRAGEARQKFQMAAALGTGGPVARCAAMRFQVLRQGDSGAGADPQCACMSGLLEWLASPCGNP